MKRERERERERRGEESEKRGGLSKNVNRGPFGASFKCLCLIVVGQFVQ